jgi:hypothetical protein
MAKAWKNQGSALIWILPSLGAYTELGEFARCRVVEQDDTGTRRRLPARMRRAAPLVKGGPQSGPWVACRCAASTPAPARRRWASRGRGTRCGPGWRSNRRHRKRRRRNKHLSPSPSDPLANRRGGSLLLQLLPWRRWSLPGPRSASPDRSLAGARLHHRPRWCIVALASRWFQGRSAGHARAIALPSG